MAFAYDGAWAEYTVAQAAGLTRVPDNVPLEQAAILADAVSTPFGAVVHTARWVSANRSGCGASAASAPTSCNWPAWWAPRRSSPWTSIPWCANAPWNWVPTMRSIHATTAWPTRFWRPPAAADSTSAFDAVGLRVTFEQALDRLTNGGRLVSVGMSAETPTVGPTSLFGLDQDVRFSATSATTTRTSRRWPTWCHAAGWISRVRSAPWCHWRTSPQGIEMLEKQDGNPIRILVQP